MEPTFVLYNSKDPYAWSIPQRVVFFPHAKYLDVITVTYDKGNDCREEYQTSTTIHVKLHHFSLSMELEDGKAYEMPIQDARAVWNYLANELGWLRC